MTRIGRRLIPPDGVSVKVGDIVRYEVVYDSGEVGYIETIYDKFDEDFKDQVNNCIKIGE